MAAEILRARLEVYPTALFYEWVDRGKFNALNHIEAKYDGVLDYHNKRHSETVVSGSVAILWAIHEASPSLVPFRQIKLIELPAANHDRVQDSRIRLDGTRKMYVGRNEQASANVLRSFMKRANEAEKRSVFSMEDIALSAVSILATKPDFDGPRVLQPGLTKDSPPFTIALCLADLQLAGRYPDDFIQGINALFREMNPDIAKAIDQGDISQSDETIFKDRMLAWTQCQIVFAEHRKEVLPEQIQGLSDSAQKAVLRLFNKFDESIGMVTKLARDREEMSFDELVRSFRFQTP